MYVQILTMLEQLRRDWSSKIVSIVANFMESGSLPPNLDRNPGEQTNPKSMRIRRNTDVNYKNSLPWTVQPGRTRKLPAAPSQSKPRSGSLRQRCFLFIPKHNKFSYRCIKNCESIRKNVKIIRCCFCKKPGNYVWKRLGNLLWESTSDSSNLRIRQFAIQFCGSGIRCLFVPWNRDPG